MSSLANFQMYLRVLEKSKAIQSILNLHRTVVRFTYEHLEVALPFLEPLKEELQRIGEMGVIRKVDRPTDWCHPVVIGKSDFA